MIDFTIRLLALVLISAGEPSWVSRDSFAYRRLSQADGLSDSTIFSIAQDSSGLIWLGTGSGGVNIYDGYSFRAMTHSPAPNSLSHNDVSVVMTDSRGRIWIATWGAGLNRFSPRDGGFKRLNPTTAPAYIQTLFEDSIGRLWVGSADAGLRLVDPANDRILPAPGGASTAEDARVWDVAETADGRIWIATDDGLLALDPQGGVEELPFDREHPRSLLGDGDTLWIGTFSRLLRLVAGDPTVQELVTDLQPINTLERSGTGDVLVGTMAGLLQFDPVYDRLAPPFGGVDPVVLPDRNIRDIHVDSTGLLWLATREAGVVVGQPGRNGFAGLLLQGSPDAATSVLALGPGKLLLGSRSGLWRVDYGPDGTALEIVDGSPGVPITQLLDTGGGMVWVGSVSGLFRYSAADRTLSPVVLPEGLTNPNVTELRSDDDGSVWVGAWTAGVFRVFPDSLQSTRWRISDETLSSDPVEVSAIVPTAEAVWLGTWSDGLFRLDRSGRVTERYRHDPKDPGSLPHGHVFDLYAEPDGYLWVGTGFGLARLDPATGHIERISIWPDNAAAPIQSIRDDGQGHLWLSTKRGVVRLGKRDLNTTWFSSGDGLAVTEFYVQSSDRTESGEIQFGGVGGVVMFDPGNVQVSIRPPEVAITRTIIDGSEDFPSHGQVVVGADSRTVRLEFSAMDYKLPEHNRFQFFLDGYDEGWGAVTDRREVSYSNLRPGGYVFRVRAANSNGIWNLDGATLDLQVAPHWWETWPGRVSIAAGMLLLVWLWHWQRTLRIRAVNRELEQRVAAKTAELSAANRQLEEVAVTDYLTDLANRRGFSQTLEQFVPHDRGPARLCLALGDIDNFKQINDRFGHEVGDEVLRQVAEMARRQIRDQDHVGRWGGEEFIFLFPDTSLDEAMRVCERVRASIETIRADADQPPHAVTITLGVAAYSPRERMAHWILRADQAAYAGKLAGKNRVVRAEPEAVRG